MVSMTGEPPNADPALDEQLVAYLDGELDERAGRQIEQLLADDPQVRQRLQRLERAWELLDELDVSQVSEQFTQTTLEIVTVAAKQHVEQDVAAAPRRRWAVIGGSLLAAGLAGFLAVAWLRPDPDRQLIEDLPVLENLDHYRQIDDIEVLRLLAEKKMFFEEVEEHEQKQFLRRQQQQRFAQLDPAEQDRLRNLHRQIENHPNADELRRVMKGYCAWLKTLSWQKRAELLELKPAERVKAIKKLLAARAKRRKRLPGESAKRLTEQDKTALNRWMVQYVGRRMTQYQVRLAEHLPPARRKELMKMNKPARRAAIQAQIWKLLQANPGKLPAPTHRELAELQSKLSEPARKQLAALSATEQGRIVLGWAQQIRRHPRSTRRPEPGRHGTRPGKPGPSRPRPQRPKDGSPSKSGPAAAGSRPPPAALPKRP